MPRNNWFKRRLLFYPQPAPKAPTPFSIDDILTRKAAVASSNDQTHLRRGLIPTPPSADDEDDDGAGDDGDDSNDGDQPLNLTTNVKDEENLDGDEMRARGRNSRSEPWSVPSLTELFAI